MKGTKHLTAGAVVGFVTGLGFTIAHNDVTIPYHPEFASMTDSNLIFSDASFVGVCAWVGCMLGSIFPDVDMGHSMMSSHEAAFSGLAEGLKIRHRMFTHTLVGMFLITTIIFYTFVFFGMTFRTPLSFCFGFFIGYLLHLLQDSATHDGIMLFYPFFSVPFHITGPLATKRRTDEDSNRYQNTFTLILIILFSLSIYIFRNKILNFILSGSFF